MGQFHLIKKDEQGAALIHVIMIGVLIAIVAYMLTYFLSYSDQRSSRIIHRNENVSTAMNLSDLVNDRVRVRESAEVLTKDAGGSERLYP